MLNWPLAMPKVLSMHFRDKTDAVWVHGGGGSCEVYRSWSAVTAGKYRGQGEFTASALAPEMPQSASGTAAGVVTLWTVPEGRWFVAELQEIWSLEVVEDLKKERFDDLEKRFAEQRRLENEKFFLNSLMSDWYAEAARPGAGLLGFDWTGHLAKLNRWQAAKPESITARLVKAKYHLLKGWHSRGGGLAGTVSEEAFKVFHDELSTAVEILDEAEKLQEKDPELYRLRVAAGKGLSWTRDLIDKAVEEGQAVNAKYIPLYREAAEYLLPRWHGEPGDLGRFAETVSKRVAENSPKSADLVYAMVAIAVLDYEGMDTLSTGGFSSERIALGWEQAKQLVPRSEDLPQAFGFLACLGQDRKLALETVPHLQFADSAKYWVHTSFLENWKKWLRPEQPHGQELRTLVGHQLGGTQVQWLGSNLLATAGNGRYEAVKFWNARTGKKELELGKFAIQYGVTSMAIHPSGALAVTGGGITRRNEKRLEAELYLWNIQTGSALPLPGHGARVKVATFSRSGGQFVTGDDLGTALLWTLGREELGQPVSLPHKADARYASFSEGDGLLATGGEESVVRFWKPADGSLVHELETNAGVVNRLGFANRGGLLAVASADGRMRIYDTADGYRLVRDFAGQKEMYCLSWSPDDKLLAVGDRAAEIAIYRAADGKLLKTLQGHWWTVRDVDFSPNGKVLASTSDDMTVKLWNVAAVKP